MILEIITGKDSPILRTVCDEVKDFDKSLKKLVEDMKETMHDARGLGIAAPQVNINARVFIVTLGHGTKNPVEVAMVNPTITSKSKETYVDEEGCLSLPNTYGRVERPNEINVEYFNIKGEKKSLKLAGLDARVVLHENDHIDGVLFIDKLVG